MACEVGGQNLSNDPDRSVNRGSERTLPVRERAAEEGTGPEDRADAFTVSGEISGGEAGGADRIEGTRFRIFEDYERLIIDFAKRKGEAGVPRWTVQSPEEGGYVRLRFPDVRSTEVTHEDFVGSVLDEVYVVRDREGGLFADVFATHEFRYRVTEMPEAGRLAIDFRGVPEEIRFPPTTGDKVVVLQPREAEEIESPIAVRGYARLFEGQVSISILDRERDVISSKTLRTNDWASTWGHFETTIGFSGYEGLATIRVGSRSPKDGSFVGTETEVFLESSGPG